MQGPNSSAQSLSAGWSIVIGHFGSAFALPSSLPTTDESGLAPWALSDDEQIAKTRYTGVGFDTP